MQGPEAIVGSRRLMSSLLDAQLGRWSLGSSGITSHLAFSDSCLLLSFFAECFYLNSDLLDGHR